MSASGFVSRWKKHSQYSNSDLKSLRDFLSWRKDQEKGQKYSAWLKVYFPDIKLWPWQKVLGITGQWRDCIMRYGGLHLWVIWVVITCQFFSGLCEMSVVLYEKHANTTTTDTQNGIWWQIASTTGALCSDVVLRLNQVPLSTAVFLELLLEVELDCGTVSVVFFSPFHQLIFGIKYTKRAGSWNHLPCRRRCSRTFLVVHK